MSIPRLTAAILSLLVLATPPLTAQVGTDSPEFKDPNTATLVSAFVPGGGQLYSGETGKGLALLGVALAAPIAGAIISTEDALDCTAAGCVTDEGTLAPLYLGAAVAVGAWIYGIVDASDSARRMNARNGVVALLDGRVQPVIKPGATGTTVGLRLVMPMN